MERHIAGQRAAGRGHGDVAGGRSRRDRGAYVCVGDNRETYWNAVERDAGGSGKTLAENGASLTDFARGADEGHKWAEAHVEAEDRAAAIVAALKVPPLLRRTKEWAACRLRQSCQRGVTIAALRLCAKAI